VVTKTRQQREQELLAKMLTEEGSNEIYLLYAQITGASPDVGTLIRTEMIPAILDREYPSP